MHRITSAAGAEQGVVWFSRKKRSQHFLVAA
jgi:hypothetical protein